MEDSLKFLSIGGKVLLYAILVVCFEVCYPSGSKQLARSDDSVIRFCVCQKCVAVSFQATYIKVGFSSTILKPTHYEAKLFLVEIS